MVLAATCMNTRCDCLDIKFLGFLQSSLEADYRSLPQDSFQLEGAPSYLFIQLLVFIEHLLEAISSSS